MLNNAFYVYILECRDKSYYIGHTDDIEKRLVEHAEGLSHYTSTRLPIALIYFEQFQTRNEALAAEDKLKGWSRKKKEAFIKKDFDALQKLSKNKTGT